MKAYIQAEENGEYYNVNAFIASVGFKSLGFDVIKYVHAKDVQEDDQGAVFVGGVANVRNRLALLGITKPDEIEYPKDLKDFLKRKVWTSTLDQIITNRKMGVFIKPMETKLFQGKVIKEFKDLIGLNYPREVKIWCSEQIDIVTEWRCFVRYRELFDVRYYKGNWDSKLDLDIVNDAIKKYKNQPSAYCLDFGVDVHGEHYLIEVNDGHSLGSYGMGAISYAKFLSARWSELTNTQDYLHF